MKNHAPNVDFSPLISFILFIVEMRSLLIFSLSFLLAFAFDDFAMPDDDNVQLSGPNVVVDLTKDNFTQFLLLHPVVLAEFYAPW